MPIYLNIIKELKQAYLLKPDEYNEMLALHEENRLVSILLY